MPKVYRERDRNVTVGRVFTGGGRDLESSPCSPPCVTVFYIEQLIENSFGKTMNQLFQENLSHLSALRSTSFVKLIVIVNVVDSTLKLEICLESVSLISWIFTEPFFSLARDVTALLVYPNTIQKYFSLWISCGISSDLKALIFCFRSTARIGKRL